MSAHRFRIAFSFAGEKRDFVKQTADLLARQLGQERILYDKYHEAEFAVYDLGIRLPKLYGEQSDLIVPVLCTNYDAKRWTGWEWVHIYGLLTKAHGHRVMPSRFDYANADGLSPASGFIELDQKTPEQFATLILERLAINEGKPKNHYAQPAAPATGMNVLHTSIPHNLPRLEIFFGREDELRRMAEALDPQARTWGVLIDGPGGMGKTSLAVRAAYDASPDLFKRIIYITLKSREMDDDGVRDLSGFLISGLQELWGELARELGRDDILKTDPEQRPRLLLDALRTTQTLLLLDNLESLTKPERDTLFTFIKRLPADCKSILTSRGRIGPGAEEIILEQLSPEAALQTLAELAKHNPLLAQTNEAERLTLYRETGGKPLLLRWTAGQIGRGHCRTFSDALDFLRSCPKGNDPLEFIFGDLVQDFTEAETQTLCALSYFSQPAKLAHIAINANLPEPEAELTLKALCNRSLVVPSEEFSTYSLVPMVAAFLRKVKPEVMQQTGRRLEQRAFALIMENGFDNHERFSTLEAAWPSIAPALALFLEGDNERLQTVCEALRKFFNFHGRWDEWPVLNQKAECRALAAADIKNAGWRAYQVGWAYYLRQQADDVLACAERAAAHWADVGVRERAMAIHLRGLGHQLKQDYSAAIAALQDVLAIDRTLKAESMDVSITLNSLANVERASGDDIAAEQHFREALRIAYAVDYAEGVATYTGNLVELALDREDWAEAEAQAREALALSQGVGRQELIARDDWCLAKAMIRQSLARASEALPYAKEAVAIYTRLGSPDLKEAQAVLAEVEAALADGAGAKF